MRSISDRNLRGEVAALIASENGPSQATLSREAGLSPSALNQWLRERYAGDNLAVEIKLSQYLETYYARLAREKALPQAPGWIATPTSERILQTLGYAQIAGDIVIVYGGALDEQDWGIDGAGAPVAIRSENLYSGAIDALKVGLWGLRWEQRFTLDAVDPATLAPFLTFHEDTDMAPADGVIDMSETDELQQ
ncbi:MAG: hypothetical protein ACRES7_00140 [Gammaproteobacteria bacterium]